jgi:acyl-CoA thioester hydrolase
MTETQSTPITPGVAKGVAMPANVYLDDLDGYGMLNHTKYATLFDHAVIDFWTQAGWALDPAREIFVIRELHLKYHQPVTSIGEISVHMWVDQATPTSVTYQFEVLSTDHSTLHAEGWRRLVHLDPSTLRPSPIDDEGWKTAAPLLGPDFVRPVA